MHASPCASLKWHVFFAIKDMHQNKRLACHCLACTHLVAKVFGSYCLFDILSCLQLGGKRFRAESFVHSALCPAARTSLPRASTRTFRSIREFFEQIAHTFYVISTFSAPLHMRGSDVIKPASHLDIKCRHSLCFLVISA